MAKQFSLPPAPVRLLALDLDGTLLNTQKQVSARNRRALAAAAAAGVTVTPCSGRALDSIPEEVLTLPGVRYVVTSGGGAAYDLSTGQQLVCNPLPVQTVQRVLRQTRQAGGWGECYTGRHAYTESGEIPLIREFIRSRDFVYLARQPVEELARWARENAAQVVKLNLMFASADARAALHEQLAAQPDILLTSASSVNLEVNAAGRGKGDALCRLGAALGIAPAEMMACGDQVNDLSMLEAVGFPVAMGNALAQVKERAAFVTATNDEDGVAQAVERFVLHG